MPTPRRRLAPVLLLSLAAALSGCAGTTTTPALTTDQPGAEPMPSPATPSPSAGPATPSVELTPVPGDASGSPGASGDGGSGSTTDTDWGRILDAVPEGFPIHPEARPMEPLEGPASGTWLAQEAVDPVAEWYAAAFEDIGWATVELGGPLEDGSRVLDLASDLPECRAQLTFRPADASTIISVLYGAGCAGGDG